MRLNAGGGAAVFCLLSTLVTASCATYQGSAGQSAGPASTIGSRTIPPATYSGAIQKTFTGNDGVELEPPDRSAAIDWADAYAQTCSSSTDGVCGLDAPTIVLADATDLNSGKLASDGSIVPTLNHTLVYDISWTHQTCAIPAAFVPASGCKLSDYVDAATGKVLFIDNDPRAQ